MIGGSRAELFNDRKEPDDDRSAAHQADASTKKSNAYRDHSYSVKISPPPEPPGAADESGASVARVCRKFRDRYIVNPAGAGRQ